MHMEIWKDIEGKEGKFQVSNKGRIKSLERIVIRSNGRLFHVREKILKPVVGNECGHLQVDLGNSRVHEMKHIHKIVAKAFIPNQNGYTVVHHIDHNPTNNCVENLVWMSDEEHKRLHGEERAKTVYQYTLDGKLVRVWKNASEAARELGFSQGNICACCNGKYKQAYGYIWSYTQL